MLVTATATVPELKYEGDTTTVDAAAVLGNGSRIMLNYALGLLLTSNSPSLIDRPTSAGASEP